MEWWTYHDDGSPKYFAPVMMRRAKPVLQWSGSVEREFRLAFRLRGPKPFHRKRSRPATGRRR